MELRAFAERVLFATTLEEKLQAPGPVTDQQPGPALAAPAAPGRPRELRFKERGSGAGEFPGLHRLDRADERGRILHFFANHELLATELMALVLLRFPDAPAAFRRGVLRTLEEEQQHTRWYLDRMRDCGIGFGELPVSGYFWRAVSGMGSPLDYVAGLSLTFEQANLDFARQFAGGFAAAGDAATAALLDRIYRDEIAHVAYGLKWFRRWKQPGRGDWEAYCAQLKFPLTPQRAKGVGGPFNVEGRRAAGLEPAFIAELQVYAASRGRTPSVYCFNPFAEGWMARGPGFTPARHQAALASDLAHVPMFLCRRDDVVLVPRRPPVEFLESVQRAGFALPEFVELDAQGRLPGPELGGLAGRKLGSLRPWAWGPDSASLLEPLAAQVTGEARTGADSFNPEVARLYSKAWSAAALREFLSGRTEPWLCPAGVVGVAVATWDAALAVIADFRRGGHHRLVAKQTLGLAGGNALRLWEPELLEPQKRWMTRSLDAGIALVIEPWLEREQDFSVQWEMTARGLERVGFTGLVNDRQGRFLANWAAPGWERRLPDAVTRRFREPPDSPVRLQGLFEDLRLFLEARVRPSGFRGPLSIDAFVYREADGALRLKPLVEMNPRYTMGRLTLELMRHTCPGSHGRFRLLTQSLVRAAGAPGFVEFARLLARSQPLRLEGEPVPRIREGALCLNDLASARAVLAVFDVRRSGWDDASAQAE